MKKIKLFIIILLIITSFIQPKTYRKASADVLPWALVQPTDDYENNNNFQNAYTLNSGNFKNITSPIYNTIEALISTSTDVDFFTFNLYCNTNVTIRLSSNSSSAINLLDYDFILYKQKNKINPTLNESDMIKIVETNANGLNDYYSSILGYGTYFIKVKGRNSFNNLTTYTLGIARIVSDNRSYKDISSSYKTQNPNSYYTWKSDFQIADSTQYIGKSIDNLGTVNNYSIFKEVMNLGGLPNYGVFLWGTTLRNALTNQLLVVINKLNEIKNQINNIDTIQTIIDKVTNVIAFIVNGSVYSTISVTVINAAAKFLFYLLYPKYSVDIDELIFAYSTLLSATETTYDTSETETICFFLDIKISNVSSNYLYTDYISNTVSRYSISRKYNHDKLYDIMEISNGNGGYYPIYGTVSVGNPSNDFMNFI